MDASMPRLIAYTVVTVSWIVAAIVMNPWACASEVNASPWWFSLTGFSEHLCRDCGISHGSSVFNGVSTHETSPYNQFNAGAGVEYHGFASPNVIWLAGYYRNSLYKPSFYSQLAYTPLHLGPYASVGGMLGVVTGYRKLRQYGDLGAAGLARLEIGRIGADLMLLPKFSGTPWVLGFEIKGRF